MAHNNINTNTATSYYMQINNAAFKGINCLVNKQIIPEFNLITKKDLNPADLVKS